MAVGPIPWDKMILYAQHAKLEPDMVDVFVRVLRELDEAYLNHYNRKNKK